MKERKYDSKEGTKARGYKEEKKEMKKITLPTKKKKRLTAIQNDRTEFQTPEIPESKN